MAFSLCKGLSVNEIGNHFRGKWLPNTRLYSLASFLFQSFSHNTSLNHYSVQFSCSVASISLRPHGLQHTRLPCPCPTPGACANSCPSSWLCHPTISSSVIPFSSCLQSFPASGLFQSVSSLHQLASVLEFLPQHQSFQWIFKTDFL